jgi:hypothetical protein
MKTPVSNVCYKKWLTSSACFMLFSTYSNLEKSNGRRKWRCMPLRCEEMREQRVKDIETEML